MQPIHRLFGIAIISCTLAACGGGGSGSDGTTNIEADASGSGSASVTTDTTATDTVVDSAPDETTVDSGTTDGTTGGGEEPAPSTTLTISWTPPSTRANSEPLDMSEIGGYEVYYYLDGTPEGSGTAIDIPDANTLTYTTPALEPGTYFFSISTYDTNGVYGDMSAPISATVQ